MPKKKPTPATDVANAMTTPQPPDAMSKKFRRKPKVEPVAVDPIEELRRLTRLHAAYTRDSVGLKHKASDRKNLKTKEVIPCLLPQDMRDDLLAASKRFQQEAGLLESAMRTQLRHVPLFTEFLEGVYGCGVVVSAYLVASIRFDRCANVSQLVRYCGNGLGENGLREVRKDGPKYKPDGTIGDGTGTYNDVLKTRIWQAMVAMRKNAAKVTVDRPFGSTTKYLDRWATAKHSALTLPNVRLGRVMRPGEADDKGRKKATDLFLWDLYRMGRALAGLPIRPDKYSTVRGRFHNGAEARDAFYIETVVEARAGVGDVGARPAPAGLWPAKAGEAEDVVEEDVDMAAE